MTQLSDALADIQEDEVKKLLQEQIDAGADSRSLLSELREGMDIVGERYKSGEYFLGELIASGEIFKDSLKIMGPLLETGNQEEEPTKIVVGTVKGDIHNIGKDIVAILLKVNGFEVYDLGTDVPPNVFVDKLKETGASILGLSGLLTPSFDAMKETVEAVEAAGLRDKVKIIIGGGIVTEVVGRHVKPDAFTDDAMQGIEICLRFAREAN